MVPYIIDWMLRHWLELASLLVAVTALLYARLAYNSSRDAAEAARNSDFADLRIQARSCLAEVHRSQILVRSQCDAIRNEWKTFGQRHLPALSFGPEAELAAIARVEVRAASLLQAAGQSLANIDTMDLSELEMGMQNAKVKSLEIEGLVSQLPRPPMPFS